VRSTSVFWNAGGISANLGLHGLRIHTESLKALLAGGVAFATPPKKLGQAVKAGTVFQLHHEPKDDWLEWQGKYSAGKRKDEEKRDEVEEVAGAEGETEADDEAEQEESEPTEDKEDKGFLRGIFDRGD
jgi:hypothetical protein